MATPAIPLVKKTDQPRLGGLQYQGPCLMAGQRYPPIDRTIAPLRVVKARTFKLDGRIEIVDWTEEQVRDCHNARMKRQQVLQLKVPSQDDGFKGNPTLPKVHGISHQKASVPEVGQGDHSQSSTGNVVPILGTASAPGGCRSVPRGIV